MRHYPLFSPLDDIIDIRWDSVFKATFTQNIPQSRAALRRLLAAFTGRPVRVLAVTANEPPVSGISDRQIRYDIRVRFNNGELANIEMTLNPRGSEPLRLEYYAARLYASQDIQGSRKSFQDLSPTYQIALVGRKRLFPDQALVHRFQYYDPEHGVSLGGRTEIIMIELEKAADFAENPLGEMGPEEWWVLFFRYITDQKRRELMNKLMEYEEGIGMAGEVLLRLSRDEAERARLESEYKYRLDRQSDMVEARRRGKAEGLRRGERLLAAERQKNEARLRETARKLRDKGLSPGEIAGILGLDGVGGLSPEEPGH